jgi:hypothetical protein
MGKDRERNAKRPNMNSSVDSNEEVDKGSEGRILEAIASLREDLLGRQEKVEIRVKVLEETNEKLLKLQRERNVIINGVNEEEGETLENLENKVQNLFQHMNCNNIMIDNLFRFGRKIQGQNRPILIKLIRTLDKRIIFQNRTKVFQEKVFISDDLTPREQQAQFKLREEARKRKAEDPTLQTKVQGSKLVVLKDEVVVEELHFDFEQEKVVVGHKKRIKAHFRKFAKT